MLTEDDLFSDGPEPVDAVWTELSLEASKSDGCFPIQNAGVWHSTFTVTFLRTDLTAIAYDEAAGVTTNNDPRRIMTGDLYST